MRSMVRRLQADVLDLLVSKNTLHGALEGLQSKHLKSL
jgi:hypothetical protein